MQGLKILCDVQSFTRMHEWEGMSGILFKEFRQYRVTDECSTTMMRDFNARLEMREISSEELEVMIVVC